MAHMLGALLNRVNRFIRPTGLLLSKFSRDFDARSDQSEVIDYTCSILGTEVDGWLARQTLFPVRRPFNWADEARSFYARYITSSHRDRSGGSRFNNLFWLTSIAKAADPDLIVDSGLFSGASSWALTNACPNATVLSFDIDFSNLHQREPSVTYIKSDWMGTELPASKNCLAYFDDHVDQAKRVIEAAGKGVALAIFDDDFPLTAFAENAHGGLSLPKIEFLYEEELEKLDELVWIEKGNRFSWKIPKAYMREARSMIVATEKLPNTSLVTGIHQTPYRIVRLRKGD